MFRKNYLLDGHPIVNSRNEPLSKNDAMQLLNEMHQMLEYVIETQLSIDDDLYEKINELLAKARGEL